jgi:hypothetical protein
MIASALPDNAGYVAAAYLVFLALLLIYFGIMAYKMVRIQRDVTELAEHSPRGRGSERELAQRLARTAGDAHEDLAHTAGDAHE